VWKGSAFPYIGLSTEAFTLGRLSESRRLSTHRAAQPVAATEFEYLAGSEHSDFRLLTSGSLVPLELNSVIFWQDIFNHLDVALYSCGSEDNSKSVQLSCLAPATPG